MLIEYDDMRHLMNRVFHPIYEFVTLAYPSIRHRKYTRWSWQNEPGTSSRDRCATKTKRDRGNEYRTKSV